MLNGLSLYRCYVVYHVQCTCSANLVNYMYTYVPACCDWLEIKFVVKVVWCEQESIILCVIVRMMLMIRLWWKINMNKVIA